MRVRMAAPHAAAAAAVPHAAGNGIVGVVTKLDRLLAAAAAAARFIKLRETPTTAISSIGMALQKVRMSEGEKRKEKRGEHQSIGRECCLTVIHIQ